LRLRAQVVSRFDIDCISFLLIGDGKRLITGADNGLGLSAARTALEHGDRSSAQFGKGGNVGLTLGILDEDARLSRGPAPGGIDGMTFRVARRGACGVVAEHPDEATLQQERADHPLMDNHDVLASRPADSIASP
jgi:hypothetical protein